MLHKDVMNIKDMLVVVGFALLMTWGVDYVILSRYRVDQPEGVKSGQSFSAPERDHIVKPFNLDVNFTKAKKVLPEVITEVVTDWAELTFSTDGAALERLEFKHSGDINTNITTIYPEINRDDKAFLVAFDQATPYYFNLSKKDETADAISLTYEVSSDNNLFLRKRFVINKQLCKIDLFIELMGVKEENRVRILYPAPVMPDVKYDVVSGLVSNVKGSIEKIAYQKLNVREGWWAPAIFGAENKYFVHALIADSQHVIERAYYKITENQHLFSIVESGPITSDQAWSLSFYFGPKDMYAMSLVDDRLQETVDYSGILAPLSKLLLQILIFFYGYVHNYGLAILMLTLLIKLIMLPFTLTGEKNLKKTQAMQKEMQYLEQKYKHDRERFRLEQAELIKKHGMPQIASCLPMLAQLPIFIALSRVLNNSIELYKAPFFGWITDLSMPDPYYLLPIGIVLAMLVQALHGDPKQRMMMMSAALLFGAFSANWAAGLVLYICASTLLGILQTVLQKHFKVV